MPCHSPNTSGRVSARLLVDAAAGEVHNGGASYYIWNMTMTAAADTIVLRCELGWAEVREVMAASRLLTLTRRSWLTAGFFFAALLAEAIVLLRFVAARPAAAYGSHRGLLLDELIAGVGLCLLLVCWSALRVWRLSPGRQAAGRLRTACGRAEPTNANSGTTASPGGRRTGRLSSCRGRRWQARARPSGCSFSWTPKAVPCGASFRRPAEATCRRKPSLAA